MRGGEEEGVRGRGRREEEGVRGGEEGKGVRVKRKE